MNQQEQLEALAEQNRLLREALLFCMRATVLAADNAPESPIGKLYKAASDAYELPDLNPSILNQRDVGVLREAIERLLDGSAISSPRTAIQIIRAMAEGRNHDQERSGEFTSI